MRLIPKTNNQTIKFGQLIEYNKRNIFLQKSWRNVAGRILFCFLKKASYEVKESGLRLSLNIS